jgi:predicted DsbA family dithiol-disulfide isomerase
VKVEIWGDLVCPWCYVGQARFRQALAGFEHRGQVQVIYRSFELDPDFPPGTTVPVLEMLTRKYGITGGQAEEAERRLAGLAAAEGLPFAVDRPYGNTFDAHRLLHLAAGRGCEQALLEALYQAHFGGGRSISDAASLLTIAAGAGLDPGEAGQVLGGGAFGADVRSDERLARDLGMTGVPCAVADGRLAVAGCQATGVFAALLARAWQDAGSGA